MASPTSSPRQAQQITEEANPQILKKKKKKPPIQSKSLNEKPQISTSEITKAKANLKTEQRLPLEVRSVQSQSRLQSTSLPLIGELEIGPVAIQSSSSLIGDRSSEIVRTSSHIARRSLPQPQPLLFRPPCLAAPILPQGISLSFSL